MKIGDTFKQGSRTYTVIGMDAAGRPVSTCDAAKLPKQEEPKQEEPAKSNKKKPE